MKENPNESDKRETSEWLREIVAEMSAVEDLLPTPLWLEPDFPPWVQYIAIQVMKAMLPRTQLHQGKTWTAGEVGGILGQQHAFRMWLIDGGAFDETEWEKLCADVSKKTESGERELLLAVVAQVGVMREKMVPAFGEVLKRALARAVDAPHHESARFFQAFSKGFKNKPADERLSNFGRINTKIFVYMLFTWRQIEKMEHIPEVYGFLRKVFKERQIGEFKTFEKSCQRMGLKLHPPGRPRKTP